MSDAPPAWTISSFDCRAGPGDRPFEETHPATMIAIVRSGHFTYHGEHGRHMMLPGAMLLGNGEATYSCSHEDSCGDHCTVLRFSPAVIEEAEAHHRAGKVFARSSLPPLQAMVPAIARLDRGDSDAAVEVLELALEATGQIGANPPSIGAKEARGLRDAAAMIEECHDQPLRLAELAETARMSRYHFVRSFRRTFGTTPYRWVLARRLARAASLLAETDRSIADIIYDSGFGDLSTFNARFKGQFGMSPRAWRTQST